MDKNLKLNLGSGTNKIENYVNIDYDKNHNPDYVLNIEKDILPFEDDTVEYVTAHHILEHLGDGYIHCLKELYRVCKNEAIIDVVVPHHRHESFFADPTHKRPITAFGFSLFNKKLNQYYRENKFSNSTLGEFFDINFEVIEHYNILDKTYEEFVNTFPENNRNDYIELYNNIIESMNIKLKVIKEEQENKDFIGKINYG